ncbi:MAG: hypothetical protein ACRDZ2_00110, partial [Ilumatobacteraceae bacterium]
GEAAWVVADVMSSGPASDVGMAAFWRVLVASIIGIAVYAGVLLLLRAPELATIRAKLTRRRHPA